MFVVSYDWNAMRANLKILIYCMTLSSGWLWNNKQNLTQSAPGDAMCRDLDDACKARGRLNLRCQSLLLYNMLKFYHVWTKDKAMAGLFRVFFFITPRMFE